MPISSQRQRITRGDPTRHGIMRHPVLISTLPWAFCLYLDTYVLKLPFLAPPGLAGRYDFDLTWKASDQPGANLEAVKQALVDQLGLELVPARESIEMLAVEKVKE